MPAPIVETQRLRFRSDTTDFATAIVNELRKGESMKLWSGSAATFESCHYLGDVLASIANFSFVKLQIKAGDTPPAADAPALVERIVAAEDFDFTVDAGSAADFSKAHFKFAFTDEEMAQTGTKWLLCYAVTGAGVTITLRAGTIEFVQDGGPPATTPDPVAQNAWTKGEADARYRRSAPAHIAAVEPDGDDALGAVSGPAFATMDAAFLAAVAVDPDLETTCFRLGVGSFTLNRHAGYDGALQALKIFGVSKDLSHLAINAAGVAGTAGQPPVLHCPAITANTFDGIAVEDGIYISISGCTLGGAFTIGPSGSGVATLEVTVGMTSAQVATAVAAAMGADFAAVGANVVFVGNFWISNWAIEARGATASGFSATDGAEVVPGSDAAPVSVVSDRSIALTIDASGGTTTSYPTSGVEQRGGNGAGVEARDCEVTEVNVAGGSAAFAPGADGSLTGYDSRCGNVQLGSPANGAITSTRCIFDNFVYAGNVIAAWSWFQAGLFVESTFNDMSIQNWPCVDGTRFDGAGLPSSNFINND